MNEEPVSFVENGLTYYSFDLEFGHAVNPSLWEVKWQTLHLLNLSN
jgi:hypothetical protein